MDISIAEINCRDNSMKKYDVIIVGGGLVGASLAIPLVKQGLRVAVIESAKKNGHQSPDTRRAIVLSPSSQAILQSVGLWSSIQVYAVSIAEIHVSERGRFGAVRLSAKKEKLPALGYVILAHHLYSVLQNAFSEHDQLDVYYDTRFKSMSRENSEMHLALETAGVGLQMTADLVVAADGGNSTVREQQQFKTSTLEYQQQVIITSVDLNQPHQHIAYERFTPEGPLAMLPINANQSAAVWSVSSENVTALLALSQPEFLNALQRAFGYRLGKFKAASKPVAFPLQLTKVDELYKPGVVIIGNAAHTLHPIAGQGLNLGLRDAAVLVEHLVDHFHRENSVSDEKILAAYSKDRQWDYRRTVLLTHSLVGIFSNSFAPLALARTTGMILMQRIPRLRSLLTKILMGTFGKKPRLVARVPLEEWQRAYE